MSGREPINEHLAAPDPERPAVRKSIELPAELWESIRDEADGARTTTAHIIRKILIDYYNGQSMQRIDARFRRIEERLALVERLLTMHKM